MTAGCDGDTKIINGGTLTVFDETNKTEEQELEFSENLFEDCEPETDESEDSENHIAESEHQSEMLRIKYNGEERDITLDEARVLAQKGLNYDHVVAERDTKYLREIAALDKIAAEHGLTRAQYIESVERSPATQQGMEYAQIRAEASSRAREQIKRITSGIAESRAWGNLFNKYPDLPKEKAFSELNASVRSGMSPLEAYQAKLLEEKETALKIARNNGAAAFRSVGSLESDGNGEVIDDFLEGFYSVTRR